MKKNTPLRFFVIENHQDTLDAIKMFLEAQGHSVETASDMKSGLKIAPRTKFDVLISDIGMPDGDGYELIGKLRARAPRAGGDIPAIALTAYTRDEDRARALAAGFQIYMPKPIEPDELVKSIATLTGQATNVPKGDRV